MEVHVNKELCEGCGDCISVCPAGAISIVDGVAEIDKLLCTQCQACIKACPPAAISITELPTRENLKLPQVVEQKAINLEPVLLPAKYRFLSVLSNVGSVLLPRLADMVINALERHSIQGEKKLINPTSQNYEGPVRHSGRGYQHRIQGGRQSRKRKNK